MAEPECVNAMVVRHVCLAILLGIGRADGIEIGGRQRGYHGSRTDRQRGGAYSSALSGWVCHAAILIGEKPRDLADDLVYLRV